MSHTTKVEIKLTDKESLKETLKNLNLPIIEGTISFYSDSHSGIGTKLPGWKYPIVFKEDGSLVYDNFDGYWGDKKILDDYLDKIKEDYAKTVTKKVVKKLGGTVTKIKTENGKTIIEAEIPDNLLNQI